MRPLHLSSDGSTSQWSATQGTPFCHHLRCSRSPSGHRARLSPETSTRPLLSSRVVSVTNIPCFLIVACTIFWGWASAPPPPNITPPLRGSRFPCPGPLKAGRDSAGPTRGATARARVPVCSMCKVVCGGGTYSLRQDTPEQEVCEHLCGNDPGLRG